MNFFIGIDVGSLSTDVVIIDGRGRVLGSAVALTEAHSTEAAEAALGLAAASAGVRPEDAGAIVGTGYGRQAVPLATRTLTEISCHARGAHHLFPGCRTVIDIGGQDSKVIRLGPGGRVADFAMNDKCAAGTGRFLEVMAAKLGLALAEMGELSCQARGEVGISSVCTVFAESEIVSLVAGNHPKDEIVRGLHRSVVGRVIGLGRGVGLEGPVCLSGGVAKNRGVTALFAEMLGQALAIPDEPQLVGALGAALLAADGAGRGAPGNDALKT